MTDLREIVEFLNYCRGRNKTDLNNRIIEMMTTLLDAVVEERQKVIALNSWASWINNNQRGPMPTMLMKDYKDKALHELNLEGVWPREEK